MYLGTLGNKNCEISENSSNNSVLITGISGSGKTCRMQQIELHSAIQQKTVVVIETTGSHSDNQIFTDIRKKYLSSVNRIDVCKDGLHIPLLPPFTYTMAASQINFINSVVNAFAIPANLGIRQTDILRNALLFAYKNATAYSTETEAIIAGLKAQKKPGADLYSRLWSIFNYNIFRPCNNFFQLSDKIAMLNHDYAETMQLHPGHINIIDLTGFDELTQIVVSEMLLFTLFNYAKGLDELKSKKPEYVIFIDEFQNFPLGKTSMIRKLLHEGRKEKISLILATQTMDSFASNSVSSINQTAAKLYFKPDRSEIRKLAREISSEKQPYWKNILSNLKIGESIAVGQLQVDNKTINRPLLLK